MLDSIRAASPDVAEGLRSGLVALLPIGALERHGPHLPLTTDPVLAEGVARRIATEAGRLLPPPIAYGDAWSAEGWAVRISILPAISTQVASSVIQVGRQPKRVRKSLDGSSPHRSRGLCDGARRPDEHARPVHHRRG